MGHRFKIKEKKIYNNSVTDVNFNNITDAQVLVQ